MAERPVDTMIGFKVGDVFPVDDLVGEWIATLLLAFNDIAFVHRHLDLSYGDRPAYEYLYFLRLAVGHFNEAARHLSRTENVPEVVAYVASLDEEAQELYADCLRRYRSQSSVIAQVRHHSAFHYPKLEATNKRRVMHRALDTLADGYGWIFKAATRTIGDSRMLFADDIQSILFTRGLPDERELLDAHAEIKEAISAFMRFTNKAVDEWWARAKDRGVKFHSQPGSPISYGQLLENANGEADGTGGSPSDTPN